VGLDRLVAVVGAVPVGADRGPVGLARAVWGSESVAAGVLWALDCFRLALALADGVVDGRHDGADGLVALIAHQTAKVELYGGRNMAGEEKPAGVGVYTKVMFGEILRQVFGKRFLRSPLILLTFIHISVSCQCNKS
jgi:hypothetical protein